MTQSHADPTGCAHADPGAIRCHICGNATGRVVDTTERMFGLGGLFHYFECDRCRCLQLVNVPADLSPYYPADRYYSLVPLDPPGAGSPATPLRRWMNRVRNGYAMFGRPRYAMPLQRWRPAQYISYLEPFLRRATRRSFDCRILDVGSGQGRLLGDMAGFGFTDLHGVDPFIAAGTAAPHPRVTLHRCFLRELDAGTFDLILSTHSLEHTPDPRAVLSEIAARLAPGGRCRVEVPVAACRAWREYGGEWADMDPPRHLFLPTRAGMDILAADTGLALVEAEQAGTPFEFWASELYRRGKTYYDADRRRYRDGADDFTPAEMAGFAARSRSANADGVGGRMVFWLKRQGDCP